MVGISGIPLLNHLLDGTIRITFFDFHIFSFLFWFSITIFVIYIDFTHTAVSNTATDDKSCLNDYF